MTDNLVLPFYRHDLEIEKDGTILENDIIGQVVHFHVERYDTYRFVKNEKRYPDLKSAFKALATKAQKYPGARFEIRMYYFDKRANGHSSTKLFEMRVDSKQKAIISFSYDRFFICEIDISDYSIRYDDGDENSENTFLLEWFPKKRSRKMTSLQKQVASFERYNIQAINFKGIVSDESKGIFFDELEHCFREISEVFPAGDFYPVKEIYFSNYKKAFGKYGQHKISLNPKSLHMMRDTIYHEYGHFLYDVGLFGTSPFMSSNTVDRTSALSIADTLLNSLSSDKTLVEIKERAMGRMRWKGKEPNLMGIEKFQTKHEKYLLRDTEIFARFFEAFMIYRDQKNGTSENYTLDFSEQEIEAHSPLLVSFLKEIHSDYQKETALR